MLARRATALLLPLLLLASCSGAPAPGAASATPDPSRPLPSPLPDVVARVNGQEIHGWQIMPLAKATLDKVSVAERDTRKPQAVREALDAFVTRELLVQEALARGIHADDRDVEWSYDQLRREHPSDAAWAEFLAGQGMDAQSFRAELRIQRTIAALAAQEVQSFKVPESEARAAYQTNPKGFGPPGAAEPPAFESVRAEVEQSIRQYRADEIQAALVARLRARAKIELFL